MRRYSRAQIRNTAKELITTYHLQVPIDLELLVRELGGDIRDTNGTDEPEGYVKLIREDPSRKFEIGINRSLPPKRQRFTLAHEIGHYILHLKEPDPDYIIEGGEIREKPLFRAGWEQIELEAHEFAGELLMPYEEFNKQLKEDPEKPIEERLKVVAERFNVSKPAARVRAQWLGLYPWKNDLLS
ncbi:MAG: hypothetical protein GMKNLPBB_00748 [Myxococcota bacterium]|nr:hypothetical protein [Myxococcota bacterium]